MKFLQLSDLHYRIHYPHADGGYPAIFKEMTSPVRQIQTMVRRISLSELSFAVICGDLTENGTAEDYKELKRQLDRIFREVPYAVTIGNHDNKKAFCQAWEWDEEKTRYGKMYSFSEAAVIAMDNSGEGNPDGAITLEHCAWLERQLEHACGRKAVLIMHHPILFDEQIPVKTVSYPQRFADLIRQYRPQAVLCGHTHHCLTGSFQDAVYATCGSMSFQGMRTERDTVRFREHVSMNLIELDDDHVSIREIVPENSGKILGEAVM